MDEQDHMLKFVLSLKRDQKRTIFLLLDLMLVPMAAVLSYCLQYGAVGGWQMFGDQWSLTALTMLTAAALSVTLGIPRIRLKAFENSAVGKVAIFAVLVGVGSFALASLSNEPVSNAFHVTFALIYFLCCAGSRMALLEWLLSIYRADHKRTTVLIYGAGKTGMQLATALKADPLIMPVGFIDDNRAMKGQIVAGLPVYHGAQLDETLVRVKPHRMVIAMPSAGRPTIARLETQLSMVGVDVQVVPSFAQLIGQSSNSEALQPIAAGTFLGRDHLNKQIDAGGLNYADRTVLISGAGGSIGSELTRQMLLCKPKRIVLFELSELSLYNIEREIRDAAELRGVEIVPILGSVANAGLVKRVLADHAVEVVLHAAAYKHVPLVESNPLQGIANNVFGTSTLASLARDAGVERFVLISSDKAVRPTNIMGASKRMAEILVQDLASRPSQTLFSIVRFGNVLGSSGSVIPLFQEQIARGGPVTLTDDRVTRYFMTVEEAAQLVLTAGSLAEGGEVFVLDMGKPMRIRQLAEQVIISAGYSVKDEINPEGEIEIVTIGLRPGEKLHEELMYGSGRMTTKHEKIFSVHEHTLSELEVASALKSLRQSVETDDVEGARSIMARWVNGVGREDIPTTPEPEARAD